MTTNPFAALDKLKPTINLNEAYDKELKAINERRMMVNCWKNELKKIKQKTFEWSKEDEKMFESALWHVKNSCGNGGKDSGEFEVYNWLKSIKDRVQPQSMQEWNEEDDLMLQRIIQDLVSLSYEYKIDFNDKLNWLKSLNSNH